MIAPGLRRLAGQQPSPALRVGVLTALDLADRYFPFETVAGEVFIAYSRRGVSFVARTGPEAGFEEAFRRRCRRHVFPADAPPPRLAEQVGERLSSGHGRVRFDLRPVSAFERAVLLKALEIPFGEVRPYGWIAGEIGRPQAQRAVGTALARNPIPLLIPCHRVVRGDGIIGNYGLGGRAVKERILVAEGADPVALEHLARAGVRYLGSDTTGVFCFPTCHHARRIGEKHRVYFSSIGQASGQGFRPCSVCRPAQGLVSLGS